MTPFPHANSAQPEPVLRRINALIVQEVVEVIMHEIVLQSSLGQNREGEGSRADIIGVRIGVSVRTDGDAIAARPRGVSRFSGHETCRTENSTHGQQARLSFIIFIFAPLSRNQTDMLARVDPLKVPAIVGAARYSHFGKEVRNQQRLPPAVSRPAAGDAALYGICTAAL